MTDIFFVSPKGWAETHPDPDYEWFLNEVGERAASFLGYDYHLLEWYFG